MFSPNSYLNCSQSLMCKAYSCIKSNQVTDSTRDVLQIIESRGFIAEEHQVTTEDGYVLVMHRLVHPLVDRKKSKKPVILQHGLAAHSAHWVINSEGGHVHPVIRSKKKIFPTEVDDSLAFALANLGYDVWMNNTRGNKYSTRHASLDSQRDPTFWDFSLDEMVQYDLPSTIDHVLNTTKQKTVGFVGISQGNTLMFALLAAQPKYNDIIKPFIAMAPVVATSHTGPRVPYCLKYLVLQGVIQVLRLKNGPVLDKYVETLIRGAYSGHIFEEQLNKLVGFINGINPFFKDEMNPERMTVFSAHAGIHFSRKNLAHSLQLNLANKLQKFDYGARTNRARYGQDKPPVYPLEAITCKHIAFMYCKNDMFVVIKDVDNLRKKLRVPLIEDYMVPKETWNHLDFQLGADCGRYVNWKVIDILRKVEDEEGEEMGSSMESWDDMRDRD